MSPVDVSGGLDLGAGTSLSLPSSIGREHSRYWTKGLQIK